MSSPWLAFVPYTIAHDILTHPGTSPVGREQRQAAVAMFADVSGFTAISEALGQAGRAGTEELTRILNDYFETMIAIVRDYGGIIGQFGGDALTILFPYEPETQTNAVRRSMQCGVAMQFAMDRFASITTQVGEFQLTFKAGLAAGPMYCTTVGSTDVGLKSVVAGGAMDLCADAETNAERGEVVVHHTMLPFAGAIDAEEKAPGFSRVDRLADSVAEQPLPILDHELTAADEQTLAAYVHPVIAERLTHGRRGFINEHRTVTVLFVNFGGFDYDKDQHVGQALQDYLSAILHIVQKYDGYLNKVDMGDKGSKVIILFGAPVAHEDDEERALRCALELHALPGASTRIGINTGLAFCGLIGAPVRQEYTVMGDAVNLSARLMQAAQPNQILVSHDTQRRAVRDFNWDQLDPITVKGKTDPVQVYRVARARSRSITVTQELDYTLPMVGRAAELSTADDRITQVLAGAGQIIGITAEAGMGKSRLTAEVIRLAAAHDMSGHGGECESYGTTTSYLVWHHIWRSFFEIDANWPLDQITEALHAQLTAIDPALVGRLPLLGPALNLPFPDNDLTINLTAKLRKASLESMLVTCVRARAASDPLLFVLEDAHWIDPLSFDLLVAIGRNIVDVPALLLLAYRPPELAHIDLAAIRQLPHFVELALTEFTHEETEQLINLKLQSLLIDTDTPPALVNLITVRAQGNPFYIDEMINLLQDQGIELQNPDALEHAELPDSLHSLIISRIDRLLEEQRIALKVASVIGRMFRTDWLWEVYPQIGDPQRVREQLDALRGREFVLPSGVADPEVEYLFKHIVTQEVAYESLAVATRAILHEQIAAYLEQTYLDKLDQYLDLLAYHYGHSDNGDKQREYFRRAGSAAQRTYANQAAIDYYERLIPLLSEAERPEIFLRIGEVWQLIGARDSSAAAYNRAISLARAYDKPSIQAEAHNKLGHLQMLRGAHDEAFATLQNALEQFQALDDQQGQGKVLGNLGSLYLYQGDPAQASEYFERALTAAIAADDRVLRATILGNWGLAHTRQNEHDQALDLFHQQLAIRTELADRHRIAITQNNIGLVYENQGDYAQALDHYQACLRAAAAVGDQMLLGLAAANIGILYNLQHDTASALRCLAAALDIGLAIGDQRMMSFALSDSASAFAQQGDNRTAERLYTYAVMLARAQNLRFELSSFLAQHAALRLQQADYAGAQSLSREAQHLAEEVGRREIMFTASVQMIRCQVGLGDMDVDQAVDDLQTLKDEWTADDQQAIVNYTQWQLKPQQDRARDHAADLYRDLFAHTPKIDYATRYHELTGKELPEPPTLAPLPDVILQREDKFEALLVRVETIISALDTDSVG